MKAAVQKAIIDHAQSCYPNESCGLVVAVNGKAKYLPCTNRARTPSEHFVISGEDYAFAEDMGEIIAVVHSHPDVASRPSEGDRVACEASQLPWYIVGMVDG